MRHTVCTKSHLICDKLEVKAQYGISKKIVIFCLFILFIRNKIIVPSRLKQTAQGTKTASTLLENSRKVFLFWFPKLSQNETDRGTRIIRNQLIKGLEGFQFEFESIN